MKTFIFGIMNKLQGGSGSAWQNPRSRFDVNNDGQISPLDALIVINSLNRSGPRTLLANIEPTPPAAFYFDVNGDSSVSPIDALHVINELNRGNSRQVGVARSAATVSAVPSAVIDAERSGDFARARLLHVPAATKLSENYQISVSTRATGSGKRHEKWLAGSYGRSLFILPNGVVYLHTTTRPSGYVMGRPVAYLSTDYYSRPEQLYFGHRVFITSGEFSGNLGGIAGADAKCDLLAGASGLGSGWKAIVSSSNTSVRDRLQIKRKVINVKGELIATNATDFWDGTIARPINLTEGGRVVPISIVWSGSNRYGFRDTRSNNCSNWTSSSGGVEAGRTDFADYRWLAIYSQSSQPSHSCSNLSRIYCFK